MEEMKLKDFKPITECIVEKTICSKAKFPVFDFHSHMGKLLLGDEYQIRYDTKEFIDVLKSKGVYGIVNLDGFWDVDLDLMLEKTKGFEDFISTFIWIDTTKIDDLNFEFNTEKHIRESFQKGAKGIKMWKNISLYQKDQYGNAIRTDDKRLSIVYKTAQELNIPVLIHIADPTAFFKVNNNTNERYEEIFENPEWSFCSDEYLSFEKLMEMQESMISNNPNTNFVIAHVGSYAENLEYVSEQLSKYPNMYIDISARIAELGRKPYSSRKFFIEHQNRILFGTDCTPTSMGNLHEVSYRFLETLDEYFQYSDDEIPGQGRWHIYGLGLPDDVLKKVYYKNALKLLNIDEETWLKSAQS